MRVHLCTILMLALCLSSAPPVFGQIEYEPQTKSESVAFLTSLGCTVAPIVAGAAIIGDENTATDAERAVGATLGLAGWLLGPGMGHLYAGNTQAFSTGAAIRLAGGAVSVIGALTLDDSWSFGDGDSDLGSAMLAGGALVVLGGAVFDLIRTPVLVHNQKREYRDTYSRRIELQFTGTGLVARLNF